MASIGGRITAKAGITFWRPNCILPERRRIRLKTISIFVIGALPLFAQYPAPALLSSLGPRVSQDVIKTVQLTCGDLRAASCYSDFIRAADGGNKYDNRGNLYLAGGTALPQGAQAIQVMD